MFESFASGQLSWEKKFLQDLRPTPGRLGSSLRIVLASLIALVLLLVLQMPFASLGLYFIFLIGRDNPAVSLRSGLFSFLVVSAAIVVELAVVIASDNDPTARLLSVAVVTFVGGMVVVATNLPTLGPSWALIYCTVIALWETHAPADRLVKNSLLLVGTFSISLGSAVAVEYIFGDRNPAETLEEQRLLRYRTLERMFTLFAQNAPKEQRLEAASRVSQLAIAGQAGMMQLYNTIVERNLDTGTLPLAVRPRIAMLAELVDVSAAFGLQNQVSDDPQFHLRCARIAIECHDLATDVASAPSDRLRVWPDTTVTLLDRVESAIHTILTMPTETDPTKSRELVALRKRDVPFLIPGAIRDKESVAFALKISLCATLCYIIYHAVDWQGISTSVTTVLVTGLSTSGAIKQRFLFRLLGSIIGGLIFGLGATSLLFPHMDSITSLIVLIAFVAFISAWTAGGARFNYVGIQMAFSFYLVAFEGFSAPTQLAPARDRFIGILLALGIMWFVFDQLWPVRTVTAMRRSFASVLRLGATLFDSIDSATHHDELIQSSDILRDRIGKTVAGLRQMSDAANYEFGPDRERHVQTSQLILRATLAAAALFWNQLAVLHHEFESDFLAEPGLPEMHRNLAQRMDALADSVEQKSHLPGSQGDLQVNPVLLQNPRYGEYTRNIIARYEELRSFTASLRFQV